VLTSDETGLHEAKMEEEAIEPTGGSEKEEPDGVEHDFSRDERQKSAHLSLAATKGRKRPTMQHPQNER
jgi:hypothetical protein